MDLNSDWLYFERIKERRASYFVEYQPPVADNAFATLNLVYPDDYELDQVGCDMQSEMKYWLARYRVPLMISAFDAAENVIRPNGGLDDAFLVGWHSPSTGSVVSSTKLDALPSFLNEKPSDVDWRVIYTDLPYKTQSQVTANAESGNQKIRKQNRILRAIFILWLAVIPATWAVIQYFGPEWLALAILMYSFWKAWLTWNKLLGNIKTSRSDEEKTEKQRKMDHYFYHCEKNSDGFARLKIENFEREMRERTRKEAESLSNVTENLNYSAHNS